MELNNIENDLEENKLVVEQNTTDFQNVISNNGVIVEHTVSQNNVEENNLLETDINNIAVIEAANISIANDQNEALLINNKYLTDDNIQKLDPHKEAMQQLLKQFDTQILILAAKNRFPVWGANLNIAINKFRDVPENYIPDFIEDLCRELETSIDRFREIYKREHCIQHNLEKIESSPDIPLIVCETVEDADACITLFPKHIGTVIKIDYNATDKNALNFTQHRDLIICLRDANDSLKHACEIAKRVFVNCPNKVSILVLKVLQYYSDESILNDPEGNEETQQLIESFTINGLADAVRFGFGEGNINDLLKGNKDFLQQIDQKWADRNLEELKKREWNNTVVNFKTLSRKDMKKTYWLWNNGLLRGELNLLAGQPGSGKTTIAINLGCIVTTGGKFPDGQKCEPGEVLLYSSEDDIQSTLLPRIEANGGIISRFHFFEKELKASANSNIVVPFDFKTDIPLLRNILILKKTQGINIKLVIIDSILDTVKGNPNDVLAVRESLTAVAELAREFGFAILGICHYNKSSSSDNPLLNILGSVSFPGIARMCWGTGEIEENGEKCRVFVRLKSNKGSVENGFKYRIEPKIINLEEDRASMPAIIQTSKVEWIGTVEGSPSAILNTNTVEGLKEKQEEKKFKIQEVEQGLLGLLEDGVVAVEDVETMAKQFGYSAGAKAGTVQNARIRLGLKSVQGKVLGKPDDKARSYFWVKPEKIPHAS